MMRARVTLTMTEELLGTKAANANVFADFIASKHPSGTPQKDELETAEHREEAGTTVFHRVDGKPIVWDYQIKGYFKEACGSMRQVPGTQSSKLKAYKSRIDQLVFVEERTIQIEHPDKPLDKLEVCERSIRVETMQGPRVSVIRSEAVPPGAVLRFTVVCLADRIGNGDKSVPADAILDEWLAYGRLRGMGQWRNSGKGRFIAEVQHIAKTSKS